MTHDEHVRALIEELLNSGRTPEEVCSTNPELLEEVRGRWLRIRNLGNELDCVFPMDDSWDATRPVVGLMHLPDIPGYELEGVIGHGGMGVVYKARHRKLDRVVAVKMVRSGNYATGREMANLVREARAAARLKHSNIVQIHDVGELEGVPYFTMEYVEGGTLAQLLSGAPQPAAKSAQLTRVLADAVQAAHELGVVHRDLKPGNVLVATDGTLKIGDFGLARGTADDGATAPTVVARVGTPSYMPPEQALGTADAFKPTADVYALGAILYEMLTGRPPFRGESPVDTERQVISDDPVPPSRLNPRTPRDLQTICLKCLEKSPGRRYSSARDLAADLARFVSGEPIHARPIGHIERACKWIARYPARAAIWAAGLLVAIMTLSGGLWYQNEVSTRRAESAIRESEARDSISRAVSLAAAAISAGSWDDADLSLSHAMDRITHANSIELEEEVTSLASYVRLGRALEQIRQSRVAPLAGSVERESVAEKYAAAFLKTGIHLHFDVGASARIIRASPIREQLIAALDDWASVEHDLNHQDRCGALLALASEADTPSAWREQFRSAVGWIDREHLIRLAEGAAHSIGTADAPPTHQIGLLGLRLGQVGATDVGIDLVTRALFQRPDDFWMNWELGRACIMAARFQDAIGPLKAAVALRPNDAHALDLLAGALSQSGKVEDGIALFRRSLSLAADSPVTRRNLVFVLTQNGRWREAEIEYQWWGSSPDRWGLEARRCFVPHLVDTRRFDEALAVIEEIQSHDPNYADLCSFKGVCLQELGNLSDAEASFREFSRREPRNGKAPAWISRICFRTGRLDEAIEHSLAAEQLSFRVSALEPPLGELLLSQGRVQEAADAFGRHTRANPSDANGWIGLAKTQLGLRKFDDARQSLERAEAVPSTQHQALQFARLSELHRRISDIVATDPALLSATGPSVTDAMLLLDIAEWNWRCAGDAHLAVHQYHAAFAADPQLLTTPRARFHAASAAFGTVRSSRSDRLVLPQVDRAAMANNALAWLVAERDALLVRRSIGDGPERAAVSVEFRSWTNDPPLAAALASSEVGAELGQPALNELWRDLHQHASVDDPDDLLDKARVAAAACHWERALQCYTEAFLLQPEQKGDTWFELATVQVLLDRFDDYAKTCADMLEAQKRSSSIRPYHVARACTLHPNARVPVSRMLDVATAELRSFSTSAFAMTQYAAIMLRNGQHADSIQQATRSLEADAAPGMAVINWLLLALAHQQNGNPVEAKRWFDKADRWLAQFENEQPPWNGPSALHLHNWLEAHVLREEAVGIMELNAPR